MIDEGRVVFVTMQAQDGLSLPVDRDTKLVGFVGSGFGGSVILSTDPSLTYAQMSALSGTSFVETILATTGIFSIGSFGIFLPKGSILYLCASLPSSCYLYFVDEPSQA